MWKNLAANSQASSCFPWWKGRNNLQTEPHEGRTHTAGIKWNCSVILMFTTLLSTTTAVRRMDGCRRLGAGLEKALLTSK
jgi:hypothetical protein